MLNPDICTTKHFCPPKYVNPYFFLPPNNSDSIFLAQIIVVTQSTLTPQKMWHTKIADLKKMKMLAPQKYLIPNFVDCPKVLIVSKVLNVGWTMGQLCIQLSSHKSVRKVWKLWKLRPSKQNLVARQIRCKIQNKSPQLLLREQLRWEKEKGKKEIK